MEPEVEGGTLTPTTAEPKQEETYEEASCVHNRIKYPIPDVSMGTTFSTTRKHLM